MPTIGWRPNAGITGAMASALKIDATLNIAGDSDGMKNRRIEFSIPIMAAATASIVRKGSMMRVRSVVSASLPGISAKSGASRCVISSAKNIPRMTATVVRISSTFITRLPRRHAASRPWPVSVRVNVGTNAAVIAPSANRSRRRLGMRNATLKASICIPAPKTAASTVSRTSPSTRLAIVARPITPADFASLELMQELYKLYLSRRLSVFGSLEQRAGTNGPRASQAGCRGPRR